MKLSQLWSGKSEVEIDVTLFFKVRQSDTWCLCHLIHQPTILVFFVVGSLFTILTIKLSVILWKETPSSDNAVIENHRSHFNYTYQPSVTWCLPLVVHLVPLGGARSDRCRVYVFGPGALQNIIPHNIFEFQNALEGPEYYLGHEHFWQNSSNKALLPQIPKSVTWCPTLPYG